MRIYVAANCLVPLVLFFFTGCSSDSSDVENSKAAKEPPKKIEKTVKSKGQEETAQDSLGSDLSDVERRGIEKIRAENAKSKDAYEWTLIYYMSYDNDLSACSEGIIKHIAEGVKSEKVAVVIQADIAGNDGMRRISLKRKGDALVREDKKIAGDDSTSIGELRSFLKAAREDFPSKNYLLTFLDHGGKLNEMCEDAGEGKYMDALKCACECVSFNFETGNRVRLVFLQQCGRGSIENIYNFAGAGDYVLCSPLPVGAPNNYYGKMIEGICQNHGADAKSIAETIMKYDEHYTEYTLVSSIELKKLPENLNKVLALIVNQKSISLKPEIMLPVFSYEDETNYDLEYFFKALDSGKDAALSSAISGFLDWYQEKLVVKKSFSALVKPDSPTARISGLSIFIPADSKQTGRYSEFPIYKQTVLGAVMEKLSYLKVPSK